MSGLTFKKVLGTVDPFLKQKLRKAPKRGVDIPDPDPIAMPIPGREVSAARKKVRRRASRGGRESTILATRMMTQRDDILKTKLG